MMGYIPTIELKSILYCVSDKQVWSATCTVFFRFASSVRPGKLDTVIPAINVWLKSCESVECKGFVHNNNVN